MSGENFNFDDGGADFSFFGDTPGLIEPGDIPRVEDTVVGEEESGEDVEPTETAEPIEDGFSEFEENVEDVAVSEKDTVGDGGEVITDSSVINTLTYLKDNNILDYELEEGQEMTEELASELLEDSMFSSIEDRLEEVLNDLPEDVKALNKFVLDGGSLNDFISTRSSGIPDDIDISVKDNQIRLIKEDMKGEDSEDIEMKIEFLEDKGLLEKESKKILNKNKERSLKNKQDLLETQKANRKAMIEKDKAFRKNLSTFIKTNDSVGDIPLSKKDKKILPTYMTEKSFKLSEDQGGQRITAMQADLMRVLNSQEGSTQLAKILQSVTEEGGIDFSQFKEVIEDKVTKKVVSNIRNTKKKTPSQAASGSSHKKPKSLAELLNN